MNRQQAQALVHLMRGSEPVGVDADGDQVERIISPSVQAFLMGVGAPTHGTRYDSDAEPWAAFFEGVAAALRGQS